MQTSPLLVELDRGTRPKGFQIVGLNADRVLELLSDDERRELAKKLGIGFRSHTCAAAWRPTAR